MKAEWFRPLADGRFRCVVCPNRCTLSPGAVGACGVRVASSAGIANPHAPRLAAIRFDPIEKKPLFHFYPGQQILSLGARGCNLHCVWCQNHAISQSVPATAETSAPVPVDHLVQLSIQNTRSIGVAFTYNEPVVALEWVLEAAQKFRLSSQKTVLVTNGFVNTKPLEALTEVVDAFNVDLKGFSETFYTQYTGGRLKPVLNALMQIQRAQKHLEITFLAIPGINTQPDGFEAMCRWIADNLGPSVPLHISRYHQAWQCRQPDTPRLLLQELVKTARQHLDYVYPGNVAEAEDCSTYCRNCRQLLIDRRWGGAEVAALSHNRCIRCHTWLYGQFTG